MTTRSTMISFPFGLVAVLLLFSGCGTLPPTGDGGPGGARSTAPINGGQGRTNAVTVKFVNLTDTTAVDVQFYVSSDATEPIAAGLFVDENLVTRSIGLAGSGIISPRATDSIEIPCTPDLTIGTKGGVFTEAESGDVFGAGQQRWVTEDPVGFCGLQVTLEYSKVGDDYLTRIRIGD